MAGACNCGAWRPRALVLLLLHGLGLYLFARGFFLARLELGESSRQADLCGTFLSRGCTGGEAQPSWGPAQLPRYRRLVFVVVDAWRHDFAAERMPQLGALLADRPANARLYRAIADVPTVTMQRLKGMTSGSLPTFLDASANFASGIITEDNLIDQAAEAAASEARRSLDRATRVPGIALSPGVCPLIFAGDDTWAGLFPRQFNVSHPFPSFDVADLHSVDRGVVAVLAPMIHGAARAWAAIAALPNRPASGAGDYAISSPCSGEAAADFRLLVGHFLGVDHVGHRHGPAHPAMASKLAEMDSALAALVNAVDTLDDAEQQVAGGSDEPRGTLLVIVGDHGMTNVGNHGGGSEAEVGAALLVYSPRPAFVPEGKSAPSPEREVSQVDLVPTLALLLGWPIPHASVGVPFADVLYEPAASLARGRPPTRLGALRTAVASAHACGAAAFQLQRYLLSYHAASAAFPAPDLAALDESFRGAVARHAAALQAIVETANLSDSRGGSAESTRRLRGVSSGSSQQVPTLTEHVSWLYDESMSSTQFVEGDLRYVLQRDLVSDLEAASAAYRAFLVSGSQLCRVMWTQFDVSAMLWGLVVLAVALLATLAVAVHARLPEEDGVVAVVLVDCPSVADIRGAPAAPAVSACAISHRPRFAVIAASVQGILFALALAAWLQPCEVWHFFLPSALQAALVATRALGDPGTYWPVAASIVQSESKLLGSSNAIPIPAVIAGGAVLGLCGGPMYVLREVCIRSWRLVCRLLQLRPCESDSPARDATKTHRAHSELCFAASVADAMSFLLPSMTCPRSGLCGRVATATCDGWALPVLAFIVLRIWALFTNSFIVAEHRVVGFLLQSSTLVLFLFMCQALRRSPVTDPVIHIFIVGLCSGLVSLVCARLSEIVPTSGTPHEAFRVHTLDKKPDLAQSTVPLLILPSVTALVVVVLLPAVFRLVVRAAATIDQREVASAFSSVSQSMRSERALLQLVLGFIVAQASAFLTYVYWRTVEAGDSQAFLLLALPLRLWAPRTVYVASTACIALQFGEFIYARLMIYRRTVAFDRCDVNKLRGVLDQLGSGSPTLLASGPCVSKALSDSCVVATRLLLALQGPLVLVLGPSSPCIVLLLILHATSTITLSTCVLAVYSRSIARSASPEGPSAFLALLRDDSTTAVVSCPAALSCNGNASLLRLAADLILRGPTLTALFSWSLLSPHWFLATDHGFSFSSLQFSSAFVGFDKFSPVISGTLFLLNTFGANAALACLAPALVFMLSAVVYSQPGAAPRSHRLATIWESLLLGVPAMSGDRSDVTRPTEDACIAPSQAGDVGHFRFLLLALPSAVCLATSVFCTVARRHLMVWAIFAPKFLFDAAALVLSFCLALLL